MTSPRLSWLACAAALAACGSTDHAMPDAATIIDAPDASTEGCDWVQQDHNNAQENLPMPYQGTSITLCGQIDLVHGQSPTQHDSAYKQLAFSSTVTQEVLVRIETAQSIAGFQRTTLSLFGSGASQLVDRHGVFIGQLASNGDHFLDLEADFPTTATAPIPYRITISPLTRTSLCPTITAAADYTEAHDGTDATGNDTMRFGTSGLTLTATTSDAPEPTGLTMLTGSARRIHGTSAAAPQDASGFNDADAYAITTGPDTDELTIRQDWTGNVGLVFLVASPDLVVTNLGSSQITTTGPAVAVVAVAPSTTSLLWVGAVSSNGTVGLPVDYDLSVCGGNAPAP